ncbi:MAG: YARHG domain-containing protein [Muribaculaceae bacterium]|nr:YARHG domain-containing protein [Muribaculaceae bacterium]
MKQRIFLILFVMTAIGVSAQRNYCDKERLSSKLKDGLTTDLKHRNDKRQVLKTIQILKDDTQQFWTDGLYLISTMHNPYYKDREYNPDNRGQIEVECESNRQIDPEMTIATRDLDITGGKVKERGQEALTVTVEMLGQYKMLVYRNAQGAPIKAYYHIDFENVNDYTWTHFFHYILDGNYQLASGSNAVFGFKQDFYEGNTYDTDPGIYRFEINPETKNIGIIYGEGRVSHGDPSSSNYGLMPGGGGAGAIMGPMVWQVKPTKQGLDTKVAVDETFVDHRPRLDKGDNVLTKVQCPWQGVDGKWAFASVIPLTHEMLKLFPKDVLELMRAEIYARHGDTFKSAENQNYFNQQPWYKKSGKPVVLTDIEKFNVALIKQVMATL